LLSAQDANEVQSGEERRVSKAEVLVMVKEHIRALEERRLVLEGGKRGLVNNVENLKRLWEGIGGELIS
jgi:hypothetical protein